MKMYTNGLEVVNGNCFLKSDGNGFGQMRGPREFLLPFCDYFNSIRPTMGLRPFGEEDTAEKFHVFPLENYYDSMKEEGKEYEVSYKLNQILGLKSKDKEDKNKFFLCFSYIDPKTAKRIYDTFGGKRQFGENSWDGFIREANEEGGLKIIPTSVKSHKIDICLSISEEKVIFPFYKMGGYDRRPDDFNVFYILAFDSHKFHKSQSNYLEKKTQVSDCKYGLIRGELKETEADSRVHLESTSNCKYGLIRCELEKTVDKESNEKEPSFFENYDLSRETCDKSLEDLTMIGAGWQHFSDEDIVRSLFKDLLP